MTKPKRKKMRRTPKPSPHDPIIYRSVTVEEAVKSMQKRNTLWAHTK